MEDWVITISIVSIILFLIYSFTKLKNKSMSSFIPDHVQITGFRLKSSLSTTNKHYINRFRSSQ